MVDGPLVMLASSAQAIVTIPLLAGLFNADPPFAAWEADRDVNHVGRILTLDALKIYKRLKGDIGEPPRFDYQVSRHKKTIIEFGGMEYRLTMCNSDRPACAIVDLSGDADAVQDDPPEILHLYAAMGLPRQHEQIQVLLAVTKDLAVAAALVKAVCERFGVHYRSQAVRNDVPAEARRHGTPDEIQSNWESLVRELGICPSSGRLGAQEVRGLTPETSGSAGTHSSPDHEVAPFPEAHMMFEWMEKLGGGSWAIEAVEQLSRQQWRCPRPQRSADSAKPYWKARPKLYSDCVYRVRSDQEAKRYRINYNEVYPLTPVYHTGQGHALYVGGRAAAENGELLKAKHIRKLVPVAGQLRLAAVRGIRTSAILSLTDVVKQGQGLTIVTRSLYDVRVADNPPHKKCNSQVMIDG